MCSPYRSGTNTGNDDKEPEVAVNGADENVKGLTFDVKSVADQVMTSYQIEHAYIEMSNHAAEFNRPDMQAAFRLAAFRTLEDFYITLMEAQSKMIRQVMAQHGQDIAKGIDEKVETC